MDSLHKLNHKQKFRLHVPLQYTPQCKNFHPEKEFLRSRLKTKSIDHSVRFLFSKPDPPVVEMPKISAKLYSLDIINKKKTREIISTYSLTSKMKLQRKLKNYQEEWKEKEHKRNTIILMAAENKNQSLEEKETKSKFKAETPQNITEENNKISINTSFLSPQNKNLHGAIEILNRRIEKLSLQKNKIDVKNPIDSDFKTPGNKTFHSKNASLTIENNKAKKEKSDKVDKVKLIERTGAKIFGHDIYNQEKLKQMFKTPKAASPIMKKKKKRRKKQLSMFSKIDQKTELGLPFKNNDANEHLQSESINLWKYNCLTDDFEFNENDEYNFTPKLYDMENIQNYLNIKKQEAYNLARERINYYKKTSIENDQLIQRNKMLLDKLSTRQSFIPKEDSDSEEDDRPVVQEQNKTSFFREEGKRNSLPLIDTGKQKTEEDKNNLKPIFQSFHLPERNMDGNNYFLRLAEAIEGICKDEHTSHRKFLKGFKNDNRAVQTNMRKIKKSFEKIT